MSKFTVRVELHDAEWEHYDLLYDAMTTQGFVDTITVEGKDYKLPPGEYNLDGEFDKDAVLAKAEIAAKKSKKKYAVLVTKSAGRTFVGLVKA